MTNFEKVRLFMKTYGQEVKDKAGFSDAKTNKLRIRPYQRRIRRIN